MSSKFASGAILGDLNDFIEPAQSCVNPLFAEDVNAKQPTDAEKAGMAKVSLTSSVFSAVGHSTVEPNLIKASASQTAKVSLQDCLACSGCVTSAEAVLVTQQSLGEMKDRLRDPQYRVKIVSISPQSRASIAAHFRLSLLSTHKRLTSYFKRLGADVVIDTSVASSVVLSEICTEFVRRLQRCKPRKWERPLPSTAASSTRYHVFAAESDDGAAVGGSGGQGPVATAPLPERTVEAGEPAHETLPMLASACPGWVCYAEKTQPEALPHVATTKSAQQVAGELAKAWALRARGAAPGAVYHCTLMPCFDKKLEASRRDFYDEVAASNAVDTVITAGELEEAWTADGYSFRDEPEAPLEPADPTADERAWRPHPLLGVSPDGAAVVHAADAGAGSSGGFADRVFRAAASAVHGVAVAPGPLAWQAGRNADLETVSLEVDGKTVLRVARAYGFRNIQTILRKMKRGKCPYHFVEVMACPSGCLNGGGQIRPGDTADAPATLERVRTAFAEAAVKEVDDRRQVDAVYADVVGGGPCSPAALRLLHTRYHAVPKLRSPLTIGW